MPITRQELNQDIDSKIVDNNISVPNRTTGKNDQLNRKKILDYVDQEVAQVAIPVVNATGTNTYVATLTPAITALSGNLRLFVRFTNANTGPATLNLNSLGAKPIVKNVSAALVTGDILAGQILCLAYDGTNFQVIGSNSTGGGGGGTIDAIPTDGSNNAVSSNGVFDALANLNSLIAAKASPTDISNAIAALVDSSPSALNTLNELAAALGNDANFAATVNAAIALRLTQSQVDARIAALAGGATLKETIPNQTAHGFTVGQIIKKIGTNYSTAQANNVDNAEVIGIVESVPDANSFVLVYAGKITLSGLTVGTTYFLSDATSGLLTATAPTAAGSVRKPILNAISATVGIVSIGEGYVIPTVSNQTLGFNKPITTKTASYTATADDFAIRVDTTSAPATLTLPVIAGQIWRVKKIGASSNNVTVVGLTGDIDGAANKAWNNQDAAFEFHCDGTNFSIF